MGLTPRPTGWVPEQPADLRDVTAARNELPRPASLPAEPAPPPLPSRLDLARLAVADRLPETLGERLRATSSSTLAASLVAVIAIAVAIGTVVQERRQAASYSDGYSTSYSAPATEPAVTPAPGDAAVDGSSIVVDVSGDVRRPGLVTLPVGARVDDAITAAGGPTKPGELAGTNLAARVTDGELLVIGGKRGHGGSGSSGGLISLSSASLTKLETLPGVGPVTAQKIVDWRNAHGGFSSIEELQQVPGIGPTRYAELSPLVAP
ncbi:MAG TPA: ComEA family DNA-binding protein [Mycobacteriales bacterium]|nr:ComEA family DNA-binding protein [Mycobacteriales bacterium]